MACRALALRSLLLPEPLHRLPAAALPVGRAPRGGRRPHLRCCSGGGGGDPGQPPQEAVLEAISKIARSKGRVALTTNMVMGGTVTDDASDEWLVLDQKVNSYPTDRGFTAIGTGGDDFVQSMVVAVESVLQESIPKADNGTEFLNNATAAFLADRGILLRTSCPYTSAQNGKAERMLRTLNNGVRTLLIHAAMPSSYWVEALSTAEFLTNRRPSSSINNGSGEVTDQGIRQAANAVG